MNDDRDSSEAILETSVAPAQALDSRFDATEIRGKRKSEPTEKPLYPVIWRWHFYAGLFVAPIFLLMTVTGALYVFRTELTAFRDRSLQVVVPQPQRMTYEQLRGIAARAAAPHPIEGIHFFPEENRSVVFEAHIEPEKTGDGSPPAGRARHLLVYLNPYSGEVLGTRVEEEDFFSIVLQLHRNLLMGRTGRYLTELATSWALLLLGTGLYLWWPRGKKNVGVWLPRLRGKLYPILRDLHAVSGFYLAPLAVLLIGTGMFFTLIWGGVFNNTVKKAGQWAPRWFLPIDSAPRPEGTPPASLDQLAATVLAHARPNDGAHMELKIQPDKAYKAWLIQDENKNSYRMVAVDQYTAQLIDRVDAQDVPPLYRLRLLAVSIHMGQIFGTSTKILALLTSIGLMGMVVTGFWMWLKRRPAGRTGFPRRPVSGSLPWWGWVVILVCGVLLPVAGVSMLLITLLDMFVVRIFRPASNT